MNWLDLRQYSCLTGSPVVKQIQRHQRVKQDWQTEEQMHTERNSEKSKQWEKTEWEKRKKGAGEREKGRNKD